MQINGRLQRIDRTVGYTVKEIMTPTDKLRCWTGEEEKRDALIKEAIEKDYTYIPVKKEGSITGLITLSQLRKKSPNRPITAKWLIAADTPILKLIQLFASRDHKKRENFLVLQESQIIGLVSPADLNQISSRGSVYLLVAHFEASLAMLIRHILKYDEKLYATAFPLHRSNYLNRAQKHQKQNSKEDIKLDLLHYVFLDDLIAIAANNGEIRELLQLPDLPTAARELDVISVRNAVSHTANIFIGSRENIDAINDTCERLIKYGGIIQEYLRSNT